MAQYEIKLRFIGKGIKPKYIEKEYGFSGNPPIVINAKNSKEVKTKLKLPKNVKISSIRRVD